MIYALRLIYNLEFIRFFRIKLIFIEYEYDSPFNYRKYYYILEQSNFSAKKKDFANLACTLLKIITNCFPTCFEVIQI